jgi:hypothetical protein
MQMWPMVNGVAMANPDKIAWCLGSDGAQQEGNDSEAARLATARSLNVKLVIDDNNVTIAGHPSDYLKGYNVEKTLEVSLHTLKYDYCKYRFLPTTQGVARLFSLQSCSCMHRVALVSSSRRSRAFRQIQQQKTRRCSHG